MTHANTPHVHSETAGIVGPIPNHNPNSNGKAPFPEERFYAPFRGACDPCPPIAVKSYVVPPNQYMTFQPPNLPQFPPEQALCIGTLWPALYSSYRPKRGGHHT